MGISCSNVAPHNITENLQVNELTNDPKYFMAIWRCNCLQLVIWNSYLQSFEHPNRCELDINPIIYWHPVNESESKKYIEFTKHCNIFPIPTNFYLKSKYVFIRIVICMIHLYLYGGIKRI